MPEQFLSLACRIDRLENRPETADRPGHGGVKLDDRLIGDSDGILRDSTPEDVCRGLA
jgi:hypothetical protein